MRLLPGISLSMQQHAKLPCRGNSRFSLFLPNDLRIGPGSDATVSIIDGKGGGTRVLRCFSRGRECRETTVAMLIGTRLVRDKVRLGWWQGQHFPTISARLRNLSVSGALVQLEEGAVGPAGVKAWICLADQSATHWVQVEVVGVCPELPETPCVVRLKFLDPFPYESFKTAVWEDGPARGRPAWPGADDPPPCKDEDSARATNPVALTRGERIRFFLQLDAETVASSGRGPEIVDLASPHPPTLLQVHRSQMVSTDKVASFPRVVVLLVGLSVSMLLGILVTGHLVNLRRLGIAPGLAE